VGICAAGDRQTVLEGGCDMLNDERTFIEAKRNWELAARKQRSGNLLKWVLVAMAVAIVVVLALVATSHGESKRRTYALPNDDILQMVEAHCVAIIPSPNTVVPGNSKGEQILELRCK